MKRLHSVILLQLFLLTPGAACDFCNCLSGINPFHVRQNAVGLTFLAQHSSLPAAPSSTAAAFRSLRSTHTVPAGTAAAEEQRRTAEFTYQHFLSDRLFVTMALPLTAMTTTSTASRTISGNGDLTVRAEVVLNDPLLDEDPSTILLGAGIKFPAGDHSSRDAAGTLLGQQEQLGTGTFDGVVHGAYMTMFSTVTAGVDLYGKWNTTDGNGSRVGHSLSATLHAGTDLYRNNPAAVAAVGIVGLRTEIAGKDIVAGRTDEDSGVRSVYGNAGLHLLTGSFRWTVSAMVPLRQIRSDRSPDEHTRWVAGLQYAFPSGL